MKLKHNPFPLILARGDEPTKLWCLEFFGLGDSPQAKDGLLKLLTEQCSDGAFVSQLDPPKWGMRETIRTALLLLRLGLSPKGRNLDGAVTFVLDHQNPDGGWSENPSMKIPPFVQTFLSNERSVCWLSADAVHLLRQVGMEESVQCQAALKWLRLMQNPHGGWRSYAKDAGDRPDTIGDPDTTAQVTFLMREIYGERDPAYLKGRELFERHLDQTAHDVERGYRIRALDGQREEVEVYELTHLLLSWLGDPPRRIESGYDASDPRVSKMMEALVAIQREDGGWRPFTAQESSPVYTALAVKTLILTGALAREDSERDLKTHLS
jgi:hypothetical protein